MPDVTQILQAIDAGDAKAAGDLLPLVYVALEDPAQAELVKLRFFAGLSLKEAAAVLNVGRATADRWWTYARAFLYCEMQGGER